MDNVRPDPTTILETLAIGAPPIGLYDAPDPTPFAPLVEPKPRECVFAAFPHWLAGGTLHITKEKHGCGGGHLLGDQVPQRSRAGLVKFLVDEEGLRASHALMDLWLEARPGFQPRHAHVLIGPLRGDQYEHLRSVTFYVNADQLSVLCTGAVYYSKPDDPTPVIVPFGSGCAQLAGLFAHFDVPQAIVGAADQAMRKHLPLRPARLQRDQADVRAPLPLGRRPGELPAQQLPQATHRSARRLLVAAATSGCGRAAGDRVSRPAAPRRTIRLPAA